MKKYEENNIEQPEIKEFKQESNIHTEKNKNLFMSKKFVSSAGDGSPMNSNLNMIKIKNNINSPKKEKSLFFVDYKNNSIPKNVNKEIKIEQNMNNENNENNKIEKNKDKKKSNKELIHYFGTPFYPEDINDEIYSKESQSKYIIDDNNNKNENNNKNIDELEYIPVNHLLSSQGTIKSNYKQIKKEIDKNNINNNIINNNNNFFISNNLITNNIINHIQSLKIKNDLSVFHFGFNFKSKKDASSHKSKQNLDKNKIYNLAIFQNSFEISAFKNEQKINLDLNKNSEKKDEIKINLNKAQKNYCKSENLFSSCPSCRYGSFCSSCSSCFIEQKYNDINKHLTFDLPFKKLSQPSCSSFASNKISNIEYKIDKMKELKYKSSYFNLNEITNGKIIKNKNFQNYIKSIILHKFSDLTHSKMDLPLAKNHFHSLISTGIIPIPENHNSKKYSGILPNHIWHNDKLQNSSIKNRRCNLTISELNEKNKGNYYSTKKINRINKKNNNQSYLLSYINKNIKDDSVVLHEPEKFYSGLFNDMMKNYSKANVNIFQK